MTELNYFKVLSLEYTYKDVSVQQGTSSDPLCVAQEAITPHKEMVADYQVWIVLDKEIACKGRTRDRCLQKALRLCRKHNTHIAISEPCFESSLVSHLDPKKDYRINQAIKHFYSLFPYNPIDSVKGVSYGAFWFIYKESLW